jgi:predicted O-methyltransferase YrrM
MVEYEPEFIIDKYSELYRLIVSIGGSASCELPIIFGSVIALQAKKIIDLGVSYEAGTSSILLLASKLTNGHVWSVDINDSDIARDKINRLGLSDNWTYTVMNDLDYIKTWDNGLIDFIMIDTSHTYDQTIAELNEYSKIVRVGGNIFLHDSAKGYGFGDQVYGVYEAVENFVNNNWERVYYTTKNGLTKLTRLSDG